MNNHKDTDNNGHKTQNEEKLTTQKPKKMNNQ